MSRGGTWCGLGAIAIATIAFVPSVRADIVSDEEGECRSKAKGDACELNGVAGSCVESTCTFNDYSNGPPPKAGSRACMKCVASEAKVEPTPAKIDPPTDDKAGKSDGGKAEAPKSETPPKAGCSIDGATGPLAFVLGLALVGLGRRRGAR